jgi:sulfate/thiosulfate transport system permease protein
MTPAAASLPKLRWRTRGVLPGFGLTMGYTLLYLGVLVLVPLAALVLKTTALGPSQFFEIVTNARALAAYKLTFGASAVAAIANAFMGLLLAWVLVRYQFPGKSIVDALIDLPFALPTAVAGISMTTAYAEKGFLGEPLARLGLRVAFTPLGVVLVLTFVGLPFVVRTVQPVLEDLDPDLEEAAAVLGATRWQAFRRVVFPALVPPLLTGIALAFARALGEYGSVVFISGNMPMKTEIAPLLIVTKLEQYDYAGATAIAVMLLFASFGILLVINLLQRWTRRSHGT